jgi:hypothetical protein
MFLPAGRFLTIPFPPGRPLVFAPLLARVLAVVILRLCFSLPFFIYLHDFSFFFSFCLLFLNPGNQTTFMIPINTMTIIANSIAPRRPNMNQPATNAITESIVIWVHSIFMFAIF